MTMSKTQEKIIRPAGAFPANDDGWNQYESQFPEEMTISNSYLCHIHRPNPNFVIVRKNGHKGYDVSIKDEVTLFFDNYDELCIFGQAITDGIEKLKETKIGDEENGEC